MDFSLLLQNGENLEKYFNEYCENKDFLVNYYLQDPKRININFPKYAPFIPTEEIVVLLRKLVDMNVDNTIIGQAFYYAIVYSPSDKKEQLYSVARYILDKEQQGRFSFEGMNELAVKFISKSDPLYFLKKDIKNISNLGKINNQSVIIDILKYCNEKNYFFTKENDFFIKDNILGNDEIFGFFIDNCKYNVDIEIILRNRINDLKGSKGRLKNLYYNIKNEDFRKSIRTILNISNFDLGTIIRDKKVFLKLDGNEKEIISFLNKAKEEQLDTEIVLIMDRVNLEFAEKAYSIYGDKLRISPIQNQCSVENDVWNYRDYSFEYIQKCESRLNLYAECVRDTYDMDGDIKSLSPFERYIAAYIMVCKFSPYREENTGDDANVSRSLYDVVGQDGDQKIVCMGYVYLLREILYRMGLKDTMLWAVYAPSEGESLGKTSNHARIMIHLKDPKYNLDVVFMADPTWDAHDLLKHFYKHIIMTLSNVLTIDSELNADYLNLKKIQFSGRELNTDKPDDLFSKDVPQECIVRAFLAVRHFLERDKKMVDNSKYSKIELDGAAKSLSLVNYPEFDDKELEEMSLSDYALAYDTYGSEFLYSIRSRFNEFLKKNEINIGAKLSSSGITIPLDDRIPIDVLVQNGYNVNLENKVVYLCSYDIDEEVFKSNLSVLFQYVLLKFREYEKLASNYVDYDNASTIKR